MSFFGSPFYPEASRETFLLAFDHKDNREYFYSKFFLKSPKIQNIIKSDLRNKEFKITWNTSDYAFGHVESRYALALNPCVLKIETDGSKIKYSVIVRIEYPAKAEIVLLKYPFRVVVEEGLFNYLQKIKWLHPYEAVWIYEENR
ncbi:MAG: hypothetical protein JW982_03010 [Spirochaetes bacterium]|nr:hypothetical protein [Spirochaetota bacterium]